MERGGELIEQGVIEIAPLAYMRGRTLNDAFVVLDEAEHHARADEMFLHPPGLQLQVHHHGRHTQRDLLGRRAASPTSSASSRA